MAVRLRAAEPACARAVAAKIDWSRPGCAHLVGIGGSGMRSLARVLSQRGWRISGSDVAVDGLEHVLPPETRLTFGHAADALPVDADVLVHSDAIGADNPELLAAAARRVAAMSYFDAVGQLMDGCHGLAVAGTHGKSTTTAMAAWILTQSGLDPTVFCGAATLGWPDGGRAGGGRIVLAEACEYRANFLKLHPHHGVLLGIEPDHFDCFPQPADAQRAFGQFVAALPPEGLLLARADCDATRRVIARAPCRVETFALRGPADWTAGRIFRCRGCYRGELVHDGRVLCPLQTSMPGRHNLLNALAAAALAFHQGVEPRRIGKSLAQFLGVCRRLEEKCIWRGAMVIDDFAHHPTELAASLRTVRQEYPGRRICCVFQPHQVSRTTYYLDELARSLHNGLRRHPGCPRHRLWIADIFRAREGPPAPGEVTSAELADRVRRLGCDVAREHRMDKIAEQLSDCLRVGDVLLLMGAGDIQEVLPAPLRQ